MLKLPDLTMPSSRLQPSDRLYWKTEVGVIDAVAQDVAEGSRQIAFLQVEGRGGAIRLAPGRCLVSWRVQSNFAVLQGGQAGPDFGDAPVVQVGDDDPGPLNLRSRISPQGRRSCCGRGSAGRFHGARPVRPPGRSIGSRWPAPAQDFPVGAAGGLGEGGGDEDQIDRPQGPIQLGKRRS